MAQSGFTPIQIYASGTASNVPLAANLTNNASGAEMALNYADGKLFYKDGSGSIQVLATKAATSGSYTNITYSGQLTSTVSTGTAPFVVTSTTPVANLSIGGNAATATNATNATYATTQSFGTSNTTIATTAFVQAALQAVYPVGSIYTSTSSTNPGTTFGFGTWAAYGAGRVLVSQNGSFPAGTTGGSADAIVVSHTHTASSSTTATDSGHSHTIGYTGNLGYSGGGGNVNTYWGAGSNQSTNTASANISASTSTTINSTGSSGTGANMPPYISVYMWQRTA